MRPETGGGAGRSSHSCHIEREQGASTDAHVLPFLVLALTHRSQQEQQAIRDMIGADEENSCAVECDDEACEDYSIDSEQCDVCKRLCRAGETPLTAEPQLKGRGAVIF